KAHKRQAATQTLVGLMWRLTLKYVLSPCSRSRTSLASQPTARMSPVTYRASASSASRRLPARTFPAIGFSLAPSAWNGCAIAFDDTAGPPDKSQPTVILFQAALSRRRER